jgi:hypothetical protein
MTTARQSRSFIDGQLGETLQSMQATLAALNQRIAANETAYERLAVAQSELAKEVNTGLAELRKAISEGQRTPWGVLVSALSVTIVIIMAIGGLALSPIRDAISETRRESAALRSIADEQLWKLRAELGIGLNEERRRINELAKDVYLWSSIR